MTVYLQTGRLRDAERIERRIHADAPGDPVIALNLALVRGIAGDAREAQSFADDCGARRHSRRNTCSYRYSGPILPRRPGTIRKPPIT